METKIDYFITQTNKKLDAIDGKLDQLMEFRWKLLGASMTVSVMSTAIFNLIILYFKQKM